VYIILPRRTRGRGSKLKAYSSREASDSKVDESNLQRIFTSLDDRGVNRDTLRASIENDLSPRHRDKSRNDSRSGTSGEGNHVSQPYT